MFNTLRHLPKLVMLLLSGSIIVSCFDDNEIDYTTYNDLIISAVSFGTIPRTMHTVDSTGKDSVYESTVSAGSVYPFTIDHLSNEIYNLDSLPQGCRADKIIFSTFSVNSGSVVIKKLTADEDTLYSTTDTLDFSQGARRFHLYGYDGTSERYYNLDVRIHQQAEDSVTWRQLSKADWDAHQFTVKMNETSFAADGYAFRLENGKILMAAGDGEFVEDSIVTDNIAELPTDNYCWISSITRADENIREYVLYGTVQRADTLTGRIWRRNVDKLGSIDFGWEYIPGPSEPLYCAKGLRNASLYAYDQGYLLTGIDNYGKLSMSYSPDHGRVWKDHEYITLPEELEDKTINQLETVVDEDHNIWFLINDEEVWYGRLHKLGWSEIQKTFLRGIVR